jgi:hypothetical protein
LIGWTVEIRVYRLNLHVSIAEEKCIRNITKGFVDTNIKSRIFSKPKRTVRANFPDGFS